MIIQIEPTTRCNLHCKHCGHEGVETRDLSLDTLKEIILRHRGPDKKGIEWIRLHGLGEPFLTEPKRTKTRAWQFKLICKMINLQGIKLSIVTNGIGDYDYGEVFHYCQELLFSIDTFNPDRFREIKGGSPLADVSKAIQALEYWHGRANAFQSVGINQVKFPEVTPDDILELSTYCTERGMAHYINPFQDWTGKDAKDNVPCEWGSGILYYDADGTPHPCCRRKSDEWKGKTARAECGGCNGARTIGTTGRR